MGRVLLFAIPIAMMVYALADVVQAEESELGRIPKWAWVLLVIVVPVAGPLTWLILSYQYKQQARAAGTQRPTYGPARRRNSGPLAPDDDPEFLWRLEKQQRIRRQAEQLRREAEQAQQPEDPETEITDQDSNPA